MGFIYLVVLHVLLALAIQKVARKSGIEDAWMGWVPVLNLYMMTRIAGINWLWLLLILVPAVGLIFLAFLCWKLFERDGKPGYASVVCVIPVIQLVGLGWVAFSK